jgi:hypothetical protein
MEAQERAARGDAAYLEGFTVSNPIEAVWKGPVRLVYLLYAPFPWMIRSPAHLIGLMDAVLFVVLTWMVFKVRHKIWRSPAARMLSLVLLSLAFIFALGVSNFGTGIRHKSKFAPLAIVLASAYVVRERKREVASEARLPIHHELGLRRG